METHEPRHSNAFDEHDDGADAIEAVQRAEQAERLAAVSDFDAPPKKRRRWLKISGGLVLVLLVLVAVAPLVAGPLLKPVVERRLAESLDATVRIDRIALNWFGGPRIEGLKILDDSLQEQANLSARFGSPLFQLALSPGEFDKIYITGQMKLARRPDGSIAPFPKPDPSKSGPPVLPNVQAIVSLDGVDVEWYEINQAPVRFLDVDGGVIYRQSSIAGGAKFDLEHELGDARVSVDYQASAISTESGFLEFDSGGLTLEVEGDDVQASVDVLVAREDAGYRVTLLKDEITGRLSGEVLAGLVPDLAALINAPATIADGRAFTLDEAPGVSFWLDDAALTLDPQTFAVSDTRFEAVIETGELTGTLDGERWTIDPLLASAATRNMIDGIDIEAATAVTLGGQRAGEIKLLADGLSVLSPDGTFLTEPTAMIAGSRTTLDVVDASTAVLEPLIAPLLAGSGVVPSRDLGPSVSAEFAVTSGSQTGLRFELDSENTTAAIGFRVEDGLLRTTEDGSRIAIRSASGFVSDALARFGVAVDEGAAIDVRLGELTFDLSSQVEGEPLDLDGLSGVVSVGIGETLGRLSAGGEERSFMLRASEAEIDLRRIRERATLVAGAAVEIDGRQAGTLNVSIDAADLLDERGGLRAGVPSLSGEIALRNLRTALLNPWIPSSRLSAERLLGESADLLIVGTRGGDERVSLQTTLRSGGLGGGGDLVIADGEIRSVGAMRLEHPNAGAVASELFAGLLADTADVSRGGTLSLTLDDLVLGSAGLRGMNAVAAVTDIQFAQADAEPVIVERLNASASLADGTGVLEVNGLGSVGRLPAIIAGRFAFDGALGDNADPWWLTPEGRLDLTIPTQALSVVAPEIARTNRQGLALVIGDTMDIALEAAGDSLTLSGGGASGAASAEIVASTSGGDLTVETSSVLVSITQEDIRQATLAQTAAGGNERLVGPSAGVAIASNAELSFTLGSFGLIENGRFAPAGSPEVRLAASGDIEGLREGTITGSDGLPRRIREGVIGVEGFLVEGTLPVGALFGGGTASLIGTVQGSITGEAGQPITELAGEVSAELAAGALYGPVSLRIDVVEADTALLDDSLRTDSFIAGLFGASASAAIELAGIGEGQSVRDAGLTVSVASPRLSFTEPMAFDIRPDRISLAAGTEVRYTVDPIFATRHALNQQPGEERVRLAEVIDLKMVVDRLTIGRDGRPFRPGVFDAHASIAAPALVIDQREEVEQGGDIMAAPWVRSDFGAISGEVSTDPDTGATLTLSTGEGQEPSLLTEVSLRGVSAGTPSLSLLMEGRQIPTRLIDGAGDLDGGLAEVMGPLTEVRLDVQEFNGDAGKVNFAIIGDRASASVIGRIEGGVFRNEDPVVARIDEVRSQLGSRIARAVPALGRVTKSRDDGPATLEATSIEFTLGEEQRLRGLDADFTIDVGTARFQASRAFGDVLIFARQKDDAEVGRRLAPMTGTIRDGVLEYDPLELPLGEFTISSEGSYDLVSRRTDVMTAIPLGALSDKAMGELNTGLGSQLSRLIPGLRELTMVPWRVKGVPGNLTITPDINEFRKQLTRTINPVNIIGNIFGG